jgi:hypothetical protein
MQLPTNVCRLKLAVTAFIVLSTCACEAVKSRRPVGERPARIVAKEWEGNWLTTDGAVRVKVADPDRAILKVAWLEDDKQGNPQLHTAEIELRESEDLLFASTKGDEPGEGYSWGRIRTENGQIIVWAPDEKAFKRLVKQGDLPGKLNGNELILDELKPEHLKRITARECGALFSWENPTVFVKAGN